MTVPAPGPLTYAYSEDGVTTIFAYPVRFIEAQELIVTRTVAGIVTLLTMGVDYTVSGEGNPSGGSITRTAATSGGTITITRDTTWKQIVDLEDKQRNPAQAVEDQLDRLTMAGQDARAAIGVLQNKTGDLDDAVARAEAAQEDAEAAAEAAEAAQAAAEAAAAAAGGTPPVADRTALKALDTTVTTVAILTEAGREGQFVWRTGDYSAEITADTLEGIYIKADAIASSSGAWVRQGGWAVGGADIRWFGVQGDSDGTTGNGTDDTTAIQALCTRGGTYLIPFGMVIRLTSVITVTKAVSFIGAGCNPYVDLDETAANVRGDGCWFYFDHVGEGFNYDGTSVNADSISVVRFRGCGSFRNQPTPGVGSFTPTDNSWDFNITDCEIELDDFVALNPTRFFTGDFSRGGRARLNNVRGQPLLLGINIDKCYDLAYLDVHFWPYWSLNTNVRDYTWANLQSLVTGRVDGLLLQRFFTIYANIGWLISDNGYGVLNRAHGDFVYLDNCQKCIVFNAGADGNTINIDHLIAFGRTDTVGSRGIEISSDNNKLTVGFLDAEDFYDQAIYVGGTGNRIEVDKARFKDYDISSTGASGVVVDAGNTLIFNGTVEDLPSAAQTLIAGAGNVFGSNVWRSFSPTVSATSGTITTVGATDFRWRVGGDLVEISFSVTITDNGTGAGALQFTLPANADLDAVGVFRNVSSGATGVAQIAVAGTVCQIFKYDNTYPIASGQKIIGSVSYRMAA